MKMLESELKQKESKLRRNVEVIETLELDKNCLEE